MATGFPTKANWAAGDVLTASAMDDLAGTVNLLSNASAASGSQLISNAAGTSFAYQATPSASNPVLNSAMQVWQRGTSISQTASTTPYTADRWQALNGANQANTISRQSTNDTTNLPFIQYCARFQRNNGQTGTADTGLFYSSETINSIPYAGKSIVISFYARAGALFTATSNFLVSRLYTGTGTDQNFLSGYTGNNIVVGQNNTLTATWQRFTMVGTIPTVTTEIALGFYYTPTNTAGATDYFEITGVQIDIGSVALPFRTNQPTYATELAACQRYYQRTTGTNEALLSSLGYSYSTSLSSVTMIPKVTMRVAPTAVDYSNVEITDQNGTVGTVSNLVLQAKGLTPDYVSLTATTGASLGAANRPFYAAAQSSVTGYIGLSAEL